MAASLSPLEARGLNRQRRRIFLGTRDKPGSGRDEELALLWRRACFPAEGLVRRPRRLRRAGAAHAVMIATLRPPAPSACIFSCMAQLACVDESTCMMAKGAMAWAQGDLQAACSPPRTLLDAIKAGTPTQSAPAARIDPANLQHLPRCPAPPSPPLCTLHQPCSSTTTSQRSRLLCSAECKRTLTGAPHHISDTHEVDDTHDIGAAIDTPRPATRCCRRVVNIPSTCCQLQEPDSLGDSLNVGLSAHLACA